MGAWLKTILRPADKSSAELSITLRDTPASRARPLAPYNRLSMIDRDQVLHVARLARLALTDDEVERMSSELSAVLGHIENINQLDLEGVEPTSHVVSVENVLREDVPRPSWPRETMLELAPDASEAGFRVPSPGA